MKKLSRIIYTAITIALVLLGLSMFIKAQDKPKLDAKPKAETKAPEDDLKLNQQEIATISQYIQDFNAKNEKSKEYLNVLRDRSTPDDKTLLVRERWLDALDELDTLNDKLRKVVEKAQERTKCPGCQLDTEQWRFVKPAPTPAK